MGLSVRVPTCFRPSPWRTHFVTAMDETGVYKNLLQEVSQRVGKHRCLRIQQNDLALGICRFSHAQQSYLGSYSQVILLRIRNRKSDSKYPNRIVYSLFYKFRQYYA